MSSPVSQEHWEMWLGGMPKPEDATLEMMWAAHDAMQQFEDKEEDIKLLAWHQESKEAYIKRREFWLTKTNEPNFQERLELYDSILKLIDEGIEILREKING